MREKLFGKKSQTLDYYYPEKVNDVHTAIQILISDIMHAVTFELSLVDLNSVFRNKINIELEWKEDNQGGNFTYRWIEANVYTEKL